MATEYGKRLREAMAHAKINQKELIRLTGLAQSTVSSALNRSNGSADTPAYAKACNVDPYWLATGEGSLLGEMEMQASFEQWQDKQPPIATRAYRGNATIQVPDDWPFDPAIVSRQMYEALSPAGKTIVQVKLLEAIREEESQSAKQQPAHKTRAA